MPAGAVAMALGRAANTLTFHFDRLRQAGLVTVHWWRSMIYSANFETMNALLGFLTENSAGAPEKCEPRPTYKPVCQAPQISRLNDGIALKRMRPRCRWKS
jgi:hypothetical protein